MSCDETTICRNYAHPRDMRRNRIPLKGNHHYADDHFQYYEAEDSREDCLPFAAPPLDK
jgi:hypothetical protein